MCCSDLSNIRDWKTAASARNSDWQMLWNGHPWIYTRIHENNVLFSELRESEPTSPDAAKYAIKCDLFEQIVAQAETELTEFGQRIYEYWREHKDGI